MTRIEIAARAMQGLLPAYGSEFGRHYPEIVKESLTIADALLSAAGQPKVELSKFERQTREDACKVMQQLSDVLPESRHPEFQSLRTLLRVTRESLGEQT